MPIQSSAFSQQLPGLEVKAWAVVDLAAKTVKKGFNVASISGTGPYTVTFSNALPNADYFLTGKVNQNAMEMNGTTPTGFFINGATTTASFSAFIYEDGMNKSSGIAYFAVWG